MAGFRSHCQRPLTWGMVGQGDPKWFLRVGAVLRLRPAVCLGGHLQEGPGHRRQVWYLCGFQLALEVGFSAILPLPEWGVLLFALSHWYQGCSTSFPPFCLHHPPSFPLMARVTVCRGEGLKIRNALDQVFLLVKKNLRACTPLLKGHTKEFALQV